MKLLIKTLFALLTLLLIASASAQTAAARQNHEELRLAIEQFLKTQAVGLPGEVSVTVGAIDSRLNLAACTSPQVFLPSGSRAWGKTSVGVRCTAPAPWSIYVKATVSVYAEYLVAAAPLMQGQVIESRDIAKVRGDLTTLPTGVITNPTQPIGYKLAISLPMGAPIRQDALRSQQAIQGGQTVRLVSTGAGFQVSTEGRAMSNANVGQTVQVRTNAGQTVSGIAKMGGMVEIGY